MTVFLDLDVRSVSRSKVIDVEVFAFSLIQKSIIKQEAFRERRHLHVYDL